MLFFVDWFFGMSSFSCWNWVVFFSWWGFGKYVWWILMFNYCICIGLKVVFGVCLRFFRDCWICGSLIFCNFFRLVVYILIGMYLKGVFLWNLLKFFGCRFFWNFCFEFVFRVYIYCFLWVGVLFWCFMLKCVIEFVLGLSVYRLRLCVIGFVLCVRLILMLLRWVCCVLKMVVFLFIGCGLVWRWWVGSGSFFWFRDIFVMRWYVVVMSCLRFCILKFLCLLFLRWWCLLVWLRLWEWCFRCLVLVDCVFCGFDELLFCLFEDFFLNFDRFIDDVELVGGF